jgi:LPS-assembly protein
MAGAAGTRSPSLRRRVQHYHVMLASMVAIIAACTIDIAPAQGQQLLQFPRRPAVQKPPTVPRPPGQKAPMLLQATEIQYDYVNKRVLAVGNVQIYHDSSTLEADKVIYEEVTKRLHAEGNVRLTEASGKITYAELMNLSENFRDGFVDSLRLDTPDQTRMAATRAERSSGRFSVFHNGVYTACEPCKNDPRKPPLWQVKSVRMIHDEGEKMIYFEDARLEFFGRPVAYMPFFSAPDPTVKRKSGFLMPLASYSTKYGFGLDVPYYWAVAPDYDVTFSPRLMTKQGVLLRGEWRQRLESGSYMVRASGIYQLDKNEFLRSGGPATPGFRDFRGSVESAGQFALSNRWTWGWDAIVPTDATYYQDYGIHTYQRSSNFLRWAPTEGISQLYLAGRGDRSYFDLRSVYYYGFSEADVQNQIPIIHPVLDYSNVLGHPVFGGELSYRANLTSLSRNNASFDPITAFAIASGACTPASADPAVKAPANCLLRGIPGTYSRVSAEAQWKRSFTDPYGQVFTPFVGLRGDAIAASIHADPGVSNYLKPGDSSEFRFMPTAGLEYRYPFINVQSWGTQTIEPIAQVIVRPDEPSIGGSPNEDSQSLVFDDSNLFKINKFSGWDRVEGGGRANVGVQYTAQFNRGGFVNAMFGQSYQLFGTNSFAVGDVTNTGLNSGLDTSRSDYVARLLYQPDQTYTFTTRYRFDQSTFELRRFEVEAAARFDRWNVNVLYGNYDAQPLIGFLTRREGILGSASVKLTSNWITSGLIRYDLDANKIVQTQFGIGYIDDCLILALNYVTNYTHSGNTSNDQRVVMQLTLRTLGGTSVGYTVNSTPLSP